MARKWGQPASAAGATWQLAVGAEFSRVRRARRNAFEPLAWQNIFSRRSTSTGGISIALQKRQRKIHARQIKKRVQKKKSIIIAISRDQSEVL